MSLKTKLFALVVLTGAFFVFNQKGVHADVNCDVVYLANQNCIDRSEAVFEECMTRFEGETPGSLMCYNRRDVEMAMCEEAYEAKCESTGCPC